MTMASPHMMMMQQQQPQYYGSQNSMPMMMGGGGGGGGANGYMEQEEEFDRDLLLDPMWEKQQRKTFTAWCNSHLRKAGTNITNIDEDFRNGLKLMLLLEILSGEQLPKPDRGRMRFHQIANVNKALDFIASKGVNLVSIGAEEIVDGNAKMTLGMIWTIILRFAIEDIAVENQTAKDALLLWCQRKTAPYKNVNVQDFHRSWKDGLAFCALIHRHRPDLLDYSKLSKSNPYENLNLAFDIAEKYLDIPRMLDAEDMVDMPKPDERAVMAYVSCFYHAFKHLNQSEAAANRIAKALRGRQDFSGLEKEYDRLSSDLLDWINRTRPWLQAHTYDGTLPGLKAKLNEYVQYRTQPAGKPPRLDQKCQLEATYNTLQTKRKLNDKPAYVPQEGRKVQDVANAWKGLEDNERGYEQWLINELNRLEKLDPLAEKFRRKCDIHEQWSRGKTEMLASDDYKHCSLQELRALKRKMEAFEGELVAQQERVEQIAAIAGELHKLGYHDSPKINARCKMVCDQWDNIGGLTQQRKRGMLEAEKVLENADRLHQEFARRAAPFNNWLDGAREDLCDMILVHSVEELDNLGAAHHQFKSTLGEADTEHAAILNIWQQIQQLSQQHNLPSVLNNPYTNIVPQEVMTKWTEVKQLVPQRDQNLGAERQRQIHLEQLRKQFAEKANQIGPWIEQNLDRVSKVGTAVHKSLEEAIRQLHAMREAITEFKPHMAELEQLHKACCDAMIFRQPYARYSIDTLRVGWDQLVVLVHRVINEVENQILTRDSKGMTGDQLSDHRRSFNLFDKKRTGRLSVDEFRALLASLGFQVDGPKGTENFGKIISQVDPMNSGIVAFESFLNYVTKSNAGTANVDELIDNFRILAEDKPYITADILRRELPGDQAENCVSSMRPYNGPNAVPGALDYVTFCRSLFG